MMNNMRNRILSMILAVCMVVSLSPTSAFADEAAANSGKSESISTTVETPVSDTVDAVEAAEDNPDAMPSETTAWEETNAVEEAAVSAETAVSEAAAAAELPAAESNSYGLAVIIYPNLATYYCSSLSELRYEITNAISGSTIKLLQDISIQSSSDALIFDTVNKPLDLNLDLNGHTINRTGYGFDLITVYSAVTLVITDTSGNGGHLINRESIEDGKAAVRTEGSNVNLSICSTQIAGFSYGLWLRDGRQTEIIDSDISDNVTGVYIDQVYDATTVIGGNTNIFSNSSQDLVLHTIDVASEFCAPITLKDGFSGYLKVTMDYGETFASYTGTLTGHVYAGGTGYLITDVPDEKTGTRSLSFLKSDDCVACKTTAEGWETYYTSIQTAISTAEKDSTIQLTRSVSTTETLEISTDLMLDLNGCGLTKSGSGYNLITIGSGVSFAVTSSWGLDRKGKLKDTGSAAAGWDEASIAILMASDDSCLSLSNVEISGFNVGILTKFGRNLQITNCTITANNTGVCLGSYDKTFSIGGATQIIDNVTNLDIESADDNLFTLKDFSGKIGINYDCAGEFAFHNDTMTGTVVSDNKNYEVSEYWDGDVGAYVLSLAPTSSIAAVIVERQLYYPELAYAFENALEGETVRLLKDVTAAGTIEILVNNVYLDLNGKTLVAGKGISPLFLVAEGKSFNLKDDSSSGSGAIVGQNEQEHDGIVLSAGSNFTMTGGTIKGFYYGVHANEDTAFTMLGGLITECSKAGFDVSYADGKEIKNATVLLGGPARIIGNTGENLNIGACHIYFDDKDSPMLEVEEGQPNFSITSAYTSRQAVTYISTQNLLKFFTTDNPANCLLDFDTSGYRHQLWLCAVYKVTLNANGGTLSYNITDHRNGFQQTLPDATKEGCSFVGWVDQNGDIATVIPTDLDHDVSYSALWSTDTVAVITPNEGTFFYTDLASAVAAAPDGSVVRLLKSIDVASDSVCINKSITLDLNGFELTRTGSGFDLIKISSGASVTLTDSSQPGGSSKINNTAGSDDANSAIRLDDGNSSLKIKGIAVNGFAFAVWAQYGKNIEIDDSKIMGNGTGVHIDGACDETFVISGDTQITGNSGKNLEICSSEGKPITLKDDFTGKLGISGTCTVQFASYTGTLSGTVTPDSDTCFITDSVDESTGVHILTLVSKSDCAAAIYETGTLYLTLAEAFANAAEGQTVMVLRDNTVTGTIAVAKAVTLNLNGFTVTAAENASVMVNTGAGLVISNSSAEKSGVFSGSLKVAENADLTLTGRLTLTDLQLADAALVEISGLDCSTSHVTVSKTADSCIAVSKQTTNDPANAFTAKDDQYGTFVRTEKSREGDTAFTSYTVFLGSKYNITYHHHNSCNGNETVTTASYITGQGLNELPTPAYGDCTFTGWFTGETGGTQVTAVEASQTGDIVLHARWTSVIMLNDKPCGSLETAFADAADQDTITVSGDVSVPNEITLDNNRTVTLKIASSATIASVKNETETGTLQHRVFTVASGSTLNLEGGTLTGGTVKADGGIIYTEGTLNTTGTTFTGGTAENGGAIAVADGGNLNMIHCSVTGNRAETGGGIYIDAGGTANLDGDGDADENYSDISYNRAEEIDFGSAAAVLANSNGTGGRYIGGGVNMADKGTIRVGNVNIHDNYAQDAGGGFSCGQTQDGELTFDKAPKILGNYAGEALSDFSPAAGAIVTAGPGLLAKGQIGICEGALGTILLVGGTLATYNILKNIFSENTHPDLEPDPPVRPDPDPDPDPPSNAKAVLIKPSGRFYFQTLTAAALAASEGDSIMLLVPSWAEAAIPIADKHITYIAEQNNLVAAWIISEGAGLNIIGSSSNNIVGNMTCSGTLTINGAGVQGVISNSGTTTVTGSTVTGAISNSGTLTVTDAVINGCINSDGSSLTVTNTTITAAAASAIAITDGTAIITGGSYTGVSGTALFTIKGQKTNASFESIAVLTAVGKASVFDVSDHAHVSITACGSINGQQIPDDFKYETISYTGKPAISGGNGTIVITESNITGCSGIAEEGGTLTVTGSTITTVGGTGISIAEGNGIITDTAVTTSTYKYVLKGTCISVGTKDKQATLTCTGCTITNPGSTGIGVTNGTAAVSRCIITAVTGISVGGDKKNPTCGLVLDGGTITAKETAVSLASATSATITNQCKITSQGTGVSNSGSGLLKITGGTTIDASEAALSLSWNLGSNGPKAEIPDDSSVEIKGSPAISCSGPESLTIKGGTFTGRNNSVISATSDCEGAKGDIQISGGTFISEYTSSADEAKPAVSVEKLGISITGGTFKAKDKNTNVLSLTDSKEASVSGGAFYGTLGGTQQAYISGGVFSAALEDFIKLYTAQLADGCGAIANTDEQTKADYPTWVTSVEASVTNKDGVIYYYGTLDQAVAKAKDNDSEIVTLMANVTRNGTLTVDKNIRLTARQIGSGYAAMTAAEGFTKPAVILTAAANTTELTNLTLTGFTTGIAVQPAAGDGQMTATLDNVTAACTGSALTVDAAAARSGEITVSVTNSSFRSTGTSDALVRAHSDNAYVRLKLESGSYSAAKLTAADSKTDNMAAIEVLGGFYTGTLQETTFVSGGWFTENVEKSTASIQRLYAQKSTTAEEQAQYGSQYVWKVIRQAYKVKTGRVTGSDEMGPLTIYFTGTTLQSREFAYGEKLTAVAEPTEGYFFVGWYADQAGTVKLTDSREYNFTITDNITLYAKYTHDENSYVTVTVHGSESHPVQIVYYPVGETTTTTEIIDSSKDVKAMRYCNIVLLPVNSGDTNVQWYDEHSNLLSMARSFVYLAATDCSLYLRAYNSDVTQSRISFTALRPGRQEQTVTMTEMDNIPTVEKTQSAAELIVKNVPAVPSYAGYTFDSWTVLFTVNDQTKSYTLAKDFFSTGTSAEQIGSLKTSLTANGYTGGDLKVRANYTQTGGRYQVRVNYITLNAEGTVDTALKESCLQSKYWKSGEVAYWTLAKDERTISAGDKTYEFCGWYYNGRMIEKTYIADIRPVVQQDTIVNVYAVYRIRTDTSFEEEPYVETGDVGRIVENGVPMLTFTLSYSIPDGMKLSSVGYLYSYDGDSDLTLGKSKQTTADMTAQDGCYTLHMRVNGRTDDVIYTRPYLVVTKQDGTTLVLYGTTLGEVYDQN